MRSTAVIRYFPPWPLLYPLYPAFFAGWRLVYAPTALLLRTAHGPPWLVALLALLLTFGGQWLARSVHPPVVNDREVTLYRRRRAVVVTMLALAWLGLTPEEGIIGLLLWAAIGFAWAHVDSLESGMGAMTTWLTFLAGGLFGLTALLGPGSWLMALLLTPLLYADGSERERSGLG